MSAAPVVRSMALRELVRFTRQPSRVAAGVLTALALWAFLSSGLAGSFAVGEGGAGYALFLLPGMATLVVMLSSVFAAMSLIEDRREGFLQGALVSPAPRMAVVGGKALGGSVVAAAQGVVIVLAAPLAGEGVRWDGVALACVAIALTAVGVTLLGLAAAWWVNSSEGFHGVMNVVLMPMWLLSGAFFPAQGAAGWLRAVMLVNPLRWCTDAARDSLTGGWAGAGVWSWAGCVAFPIGCAALAWFATKGRGAR